MEPPWAIEPQTYALRGCSRALLAGSKPAQASYSQVAAGDDRWLLAAVRGHLGDTSPTAAARSASAGGTQHAHAGPRLATAAACGYGAPGPGMLWRSRIWRSISRAWDAAVRVWAARWW